MSQLRQREEDLLQHNVIPCVVTFEVNFMVEAYVRDTGLKWSLLIDRERTLYQAYGMERGRAWDLFGPAVIWKYLRLMAQGRRLRAPGSDVRQLGGDVIVDPQGIIRLHHVGRGPADRPTVAQLLQVIR